MFDEKNTLLPISSGSRPAAKHSHYCRPAFCILSLVVILSQLILIYQYFSTHLPFWHQFDGPSNATLGFGAIYAVSHAESPRRYTLMTAANLTGLEITIPVQPDWTDWDISNVQAAENSSLDTGSVLAWLGHRNALETFLQSPSETALIIEDDVDWDVRLRQDQIPQTAYAIRELLGSHHGYYGDTNMWDMIWLGHCGDFFDASQGSTLSIIKSYQDPAMPDLINLHPWTRDFMQGIGADHNKQRLVHESVNPLCTFAYAITRSAATRILREIAVSEPIRDKEHPCRAYDVRLLEGCRDEGLKCVSVNPELFHHSPTTSEIARISNSRGSILTENAQEATDAPTNNIRCSARSSRWKEIRDSIADPSVDVDEFVKTLAERSTHCYIDDL